MEGQGWSAEVNLDSYGMFWVLQDPHKKGNRKQRKYVQYIGNTSTDKVGEHTCKITRMYYLNVAPLNRKNMQEHHNKTHTTLIYYYTQPHAGASATKHTTKHAKQQNNKSN